MPRQKAKNPEFVSLPVATEEQGDIKKVQPLSPPCVHHWIIEPANGPVSKGVCVTCDEIKDFKNFVDAYHQDYN